MKKSFVIFLILLAIAAVSCSTSTLLTQPTTAPIPKNTYTPAPTPTPGFMIVTVENAGFALTAPSSYTPEAFNTPYDNGGIRLIGDDNSLIVVCVNLPQQDFATSLWSTLILMIYENMYGLNVNRKGIEWDITRLFQMTCQGMPGEGFGFTGTIEERAVEGEVIAFERDANNAFVTLAYTQNDTTPWVSEGQNLLTDIIRTLTFEQ